MPRDGAGNYSLPSGNPVVTNTVISSTWANSTLADIVAALTQSLSRDGQTTPTANLTMGNFRLTSLGAGTALTDAAQLGQVVSGAPTQLASVTGANTITATSAPAITAYAAGQEFNFIAAGANTASVTLNIDGLGAMPVTKYGANGLQAGDIVSGQIVKVRFDGTQFEMMNPSCVTHGIVGTSRNAKMYVSTASSNATFTADELVVENVLGGLNYKLSGLNLNINLTSNGAGGLDTGSTPANGYVPIYVIFNPTTSAAALMGQNTAGLAGEVYGGTHLPTGYTHSALVGIVATNGSSQIRPILISDRKVDLIGVSVLVTSTQAAAITALSVSAAIPPNARRVKGTVNLSSTAASALVANIYADAVSGGMGNQLISGAGATAIGAGFNMELVNSQFIYYTFTSSAGTPTLIIAISSYEF